MWSIFRVRAVCEIGSDLRQVCESDIEIFVLIWGDEKIQKELIQIPFDMV